MLKINCETVEVLGILVFKTPSRSEGFKDVEALRESLSRLSLTLNFIALGGAYVSVRLLNARPQQACFIPSV